MGSSCVKKPVIVRKPAIVILEELGLVLDDITKQMVTLLEKSKALPEDKIAKQFGLRINDVRRLLYVINTRGIATYTTKRDPKKKWWYIYCWELDKDRIIELLVDKKEKDLKALNDLLTAESEFMFFCEKCKQRYTHEVALENDFVCEACGDVMNEITNNKEERRLVNEIKGLELEIVQLRTTPKTKKKPVEEPEEDKVKVVKKTIVVAKKKVVIAKKKVVKKVQPLSLRKKAALRDP